MQPTNGLIHISGSKQEIFRKTKQNTNIQLLYFFSLFDLFYILILIFENQKEGGGGRNPNRKHHKILHLHQKIQNIYHKLIFRIKQRFTHDRKAANFSYTLRPYGHKAVKVLQRATPIVTRDNPFMDIFDNPCLAVAAQ